MRRTPSRQRLAKARRRVSKTPSHWPPCCPRITTKLPLDKALVEWKDMRQQRIDKVIKLTLQLNNARLPQAEREKLAASGAPVWESGDNGELAWLYSADVEKEVLAYIKAETKVPRTCPVEWLQSKMYGSAPANPEKVQP